MITFTGLSSNTRYTFKYLWQNSLVSEPLVCETTMPKEQRAQWLHDILDLPKNCRPAGATAKLTASKMSLSIKNGDSKYSGSLVINDTSKFSIKKDQSILVSFPSFLVYLSFALLNHTYRF